jgi:16S rRNA (guanine527-N7)-methyltransferase
MLEPKLEQLAALVTKWNRQINLSGASTRAEILEHIEDSRAVVSPLTGLRRVLDVGSGGGFPVAVAAILLPDIEFVALEPVHKKHAFLRTVARELGLSNLQPLAERLEAHPIHDYDAAMSRATFELNQWLSLGGSYVKPGGIVIGFEGVRREDLANDLTRIEYSLAGKHRALVIVQTGGST